VLRLRTSVVEGTCTFETTDICRQYDAIEFKITVNGNSQQVAESRVSRRPSDKRLY
jgi:hypothetical protein